MRRFSLLSFVLLFAFGLFSAVARSNEFPVGLLSLDATTGTSGQFDITNETGTNSFAPFFPVTTSLTFTVTNLTVNFSSGPADVLTASDFTSDGSGGFLGLNSFNLATNPITSAVLQGTLSPTAGVSVSGVGTQTISPALTNGSGVAGITLTDPTRTLATGDTAVLYASTSAVSRVPEPEPGILVGLGSAFILGVMLMGRCLTRAGADAAQCTNTAH